jgi:hypothetical protein
MVLSHILRQINLAHILPAHFFKIRFNITLLSTLGLLSGIPTKIPYAFLKYQCHFYRYHLILLDLFIQKYFVKGTNYEIYYSDISVVLLITYLTSK